MDTPILIKDISVDRKLDKLEVKVVSIAESVTAMVNITNSIAQNQSLSDYKHQQAAVDHQQLYHTLEAWIKKSDEVRQDIRNHIDKLEDRLEDVFDKKLLDVDKKISDNNADLTKKNNENTLKINSFQRIWWLLGGGATTLFFLLEKVLKIF